MNSIFLSRPWFEALAVSDPGDDQALVLACVMAEDEVLSILPLMRRAGHTWYALRHRYTSFYSFLLADNDQQRILECLAEGLSRLPIRALLLEPVAADDCKMHALRGSLESAGFSCDYSFRLYNWIYRVQGQSYEGYMAARPARLRNTIARKRRKLEREHGYEIRLFTGLEVPQAMPDYHAVYTASWKANEQYAGFLDEIVAGFSRSGWSRLAVLYVHDKPVAAQLWFVLHGRANIFRLAYDEAWRQYSPGSILTSFLMEYVIDTDEVEEIDFLTGNDAYKQDWMSDRKERYALSCVKHTLPMGRYERFLRSLKR
ncbi:MAG TPA: GNAT family N-acetyltransferase, partial [Thiohalobacter sp.]|nr:GNAT family N-acetyltransferase [Thiohalobacter sp.]